MSTPVLFIEGIAFWAPRLPGWDSARAAFRGEGGLLEPPSERPAPELLAPIQRRRAPDTVVLALEVAARAVQQAGLQAADLPSVFVSAHGDLVINDSMCKTLAEAPALVSPTKFHNSVHNAAAGYWTMATNCMQASTALTAFENSFAAGLLEAATQCTADERAVLLVGYDIEARGALRSVASSRGLLAAALVLAPVRSARSLAAMEWSLRGVPAPVRVLRSDAAGSLAHNAMTDAVPLLEALASSQPESLLMPLSAMLSLNIEIGPL
jgi:Beta-ketoacyl synthase, N-terminal domain